MSQFGSGWPVGGLAETMATTATLAQEGRRTQGLAIAVLVLLCIALGAIASLGEFLPVLFILALLLSTSLAFSPIALLWVVVMGGLVFSGLLDLYLPTIKAARWGVVLASLGLGALAIGFGLWHRGQRDRRERLPISGITAWAALFALLVVFSGLINLGIDFDVVVGFKGYFQAWGILLAFALLPLSKAAANRLLTAVVYLGLFQVPFVLHQYFFLVPQRTTALDAARRVVPADVVVGTFSGSMTGGGAGPSMTVLVITAIAMVAARWRMGLMPALRAALIVAACMVPVLLGEAKLALVLLPIAVLIVFQDKLLRNPVRAVVSAILLSLLLFGMFYFYSQLPRAGGARVPTLDEYWQESLAYSVGEMGHGNFYLNRSRVYSFWITQQLIGGDPIHTLIGYGPGATKEVGASLAEHSLAANRYPGYGIGLTGLSGLLWEAGILGTVAVLGFLGSAYLTAHRLALRLNGDPWRWGYLKGAQVGIACVAVSLLHNGMLLYEIGLQTLLMVLVGYVLLTRRAIARELPKVVVA